MSSAAFDVIIVGAGPAGAACALALANSGANILLLDKSKFPRDKVCGDAIPGAGLKALKQLIPNLENEITEGFSARIRKSILICTNGKQLAIEWTGLAINSKRMQWDNYLFQKASNVATTYTDCIIESIKIAENGVELFTTSGILTAPLVIGCDGANSIVRKYLHQKGAVTNINAAAVRAYYKNVAVEEGANYFVTNKRVKDAYTWIFPVQDNCYNLGYGVTEVKRGFNVKKAFQEELQKDNFLRKAMKDAVMEHEVVGFRLPLFKKMESYSGHHYLLCGDAANLIDPLQGHGIDKAIISGIEAASVAIQALQAKRFDASFLHKYDERLQKRIIPELKRNKRIMQVLTRYPFVLDGLIKIAHWKWVRERLKSLA